MIFSLNTQGLHRLQSFCKFTDEGCYVILGIARKKNADDLTQATEIVFRDVIKKESDVHRKYNKIKTLCENYVSPEGKRYEYYIYITLNRRNPQKAFFDTRRKMDIMLEELCNEKIDKEHNYNKMKRIGGLWISALMSNKNRMGKGVWMFDVDTKDQDVVIGFEKALSQITTIHYEMETKNGWHYVVEPYDRRKTQDLPNEWAWELNTDGLLFIERVPCCEQCEDEK